MTRAVLTLWFWWLLAAAALAQPPEELFIHRSQLPLTAQALADGRASGSPRDDAIVKRSVVSVRIDALYDRADGPARAIVLNVSDQSFVARFERLEVDAAGFRSWVGRVDDAVDSHVVLTERGGVLSGLITARGQTYQVRTVIPGVAHVLELVDLARLPGETEPLVQPGVAYRSGVSSVTTLPDGTTADVLIVYTPAARSHLGGTAQIQALASQVIADTNSAFARSGAAARVRLVAAHELPLVESPSMQTDLSNVRWLADARSLRDAYRADVVQLLVSSPDMSTCGVGYLLANDAIDFDAYSVADVTCAPQYTPTHEMGHNFGSHHAPEDGAAGGLFPYSYGLKDFTRGFRTIMAYDCPEAPCPRLPIFSNPDITENGGPAGSAFQNNARSLSEAAPFVANFRHSVNSTELTPPAVPADLRSTVIGNHVTVMWTTPASASAAAGFLLQVGSASGASNVFNASVGGVTSASGSVSAGVYFWRVIAVNAAGQSAPSAEAQFVVGCEVPAAPTNLVFTVSPTRNVTLSWNASSGVPPETYVVEAGSGPSLANLLTSAVGPLTAVMTPAPPGTYYVRVRAQSACGTSAPSNEQLIVVP